MANSSINGDIKRVLALLARDPRNSAYHIQAGVLYSQEKKWEKSATHLQKALSGDKKNPLILEKLADVLINARQPLQARKYARKLVEIKKRDSVASHVMARVFEAMGEIDKALEWIDRADSQKPNDEAILHDKANFLSTAGKIEQALSVHENVLDINPQSAHSWWPFAQLQKFDDAEAQLTLKRIETALESSKKQDEQRGLHYSAGKIFQDIGEYAQAFQHFEKANLLHERQITADRIVAANINFRETYTKAYFAEQQDLGDQNAKPIFILGQTRSGTTLTESLCAAHSQITAGGELAHLTDINNRLELFSLFENRHQTNIHGITQQYSKELAADFIAKTQHINGINTRLSDKMPQNFLNIGLIAILFPNAQIIHCRRHPLDNCLSIFSNPMLDYHKEYKSKLETLAEYYLNYTQIMDHWREVCPIPIHDVFYEDLVTNTQAVAQDMISHLGLSWEDQVMARSGSQKQVKTLSVWQVRQPIFQTSKGKWRHYEEQLAPLRDMLGSVIETYETELDALDFART